MSSPHTYEALSSPDHIRVIILEPSLDCSAPLQFSFHQASLGDLEAQYEAISYCWGPPVLECPLFNSDGTVVHVTKNLESAIRRFCLRAEQRWLWADAACINQNDDQEKAVQIPLMVGIFRGAKTVLAWLGEPDDDDDDDDAVRAIQGLIRLSRKQRQGGLQQAIQSSGEMPSVEVMLKALKLHWFSRLWIIQEVVHNIDVMFHYGKAMISWPRFCIALESWYADITVPDQTSRDVMEQKIRSIRRIYQLWVQHCGVIGPLHTTLHVASEDRSLGIIDLMTEFVEYGCSDDRDRIFAMYSMAKDIYPGSDISKPGSIPLKVDYSHSVRGTFQQFAVNTMQSGFISAILQSASVRKPSLARWPSWVPHWTVPAMIEPPLRPLSEGIFKLTGIRGRKIQLSPRTRANEIPDAVVKQLEIVEKGPVWDTTDKDLFYDSVRNFIGWRTSIADALSKPMGLVTGVDVIESSQNPSRQTPKLNGPKLQDVPARCLFTATLAGGSLYLGIGCADLEEEDLVLMHIHWWDKPDSWGPNHSGLILRPTKGVRYSLIGDAMLVELQDARDNPTVTSDWHHPIWLE